MSGQSDYAEQAYLNWIAGAQAMPALASRFMALFTTAPTADSGAGAVEPSTNGYARQQIAGAVTTNATTASGNNTLHFASVPAWIVAGMSIYNLTTPASIPANTTVVSTTPTTVVMSNNAAGAGVGGTDSIAFTAFAPSTASSGSEPSTAPGSIKNSGATITFAQATGTGWGTINSYGIFDALSSGNLIEWDWLGNFNWNPFTCTLASPGVLTSPAHGYSNGDSVVVTTKYGGTLPTTAGSWAGLLTVAGVTTDTFTAGVNTTSTGDGQVRKVVTQSVPGNVTPTFSTNQLSISGA